MDEDAKQLSLMVLRLTIELNIEKAKNKVLTEELANTELNYLQCMNEKIKLRQLLQQ